MRNKKVKRLRKEWLALNQKAKYNITSQIAEGISFRQYKKLHLYGNAQN